MSGKRRRKKSRGDDGKRRRGSNNNKRNKRNERGEERKPFPPGWNADEYGRSQSPADLATFLQRVEVELQGIASEEKDGDVSVSAPKPAEIAPELKGAAKGDVRVVSLNAEHLEWVLRFRRGKKELEAEQKEAAARLARLVKSIAVDVIVLTEGPSRLAFLNSFVKDFLDAQYDVLGGVHGGAQRVFVFLRRQRGRRLSTPACFNAWLSRGWWIDVNGDTSLQEYSFERRPLVALAEFGVSVGAAGAAGAGAVGAGAAGAAGTAGAAGAVMAAAAAAAAAATAAAAGAATSTEIIKSNKELPRKILVIGMHCKSKHIKHGRYGSESKARPSSRESLYSPCLPPPYLSPCRAMWTGEGADFKSRARFIANAVTNRRRIAAEVQRVRKVNCSNLL